MDSTTMDYEIDRAIHAALNPQTFYEVVTEEREEEKMTVVLETPTFGKRILEKALIDANVPKHHWWRVLSIAQELRKRSAEHYVNRKFIDKYFLLGKILEQLGFYQHSISLLGLVTPGKTHIRSSKEWNEILYPIFSKL
jgi:hypothetical protein